MEVKNVIAWNKWVKGIIGNIGGLFELLQHVIMIVLFANQTDYV